MAKKPERGARESSLASGWIVEASETTETTASDSHARKAADHDVRSTTDVDAEAAETATAETDAGETEAAVTGGQLSNGAMILLGIVGGLYLVYTWIWFTWAQSAASGVGTLLAYTQGSLGAGLQITLYWLIPFAPAFWFISAILVNRGGPFWKSGLWLAIGALVLVPLPFILGGA